MIHKLTLSPVHTYSQQPILLHFAIAYCSYTTKHDTRRRIIAAFSAPSHVCCVIFSTRHIQLFLICTLSTLCFTLFPWFPLISLSISPAAAVSFIHSLVKAVTLNVLREKCKQQECKSGLVKKFPHPHVW